MPSCRDLCQIDAYLLCFRMYITQEVGWPGIAVLLLRTPGELKIEFASFKVVAGLWRHCYVPSSWAADVKSQARGRQGHTP